jgi:hypothetical protein
MSALGDLNHYQFNTVQVGFVAVHCADKHGQPFIDSFREHRAKKAIIIITTITLGRFTKNLVCCTE